MKIEQKWGFGMAPIKPEMAFRRRSAVQQLIAYLADGTAPPGHLEKLEESVPEVKGLFSRAWKQDQWDWFTVWEALGRPSRPRARSAARALGRLRRALVDGDDEAAGGAASEFAAVGGRRHLAVYLGGSREVDADVGYLYLLSTRESPTLLKIGYTERSVGERIAEINAATGVVVPYGARAVWTVKRAKQLVSRVVSDLTVWSWDNRVCLLLPRWCCVLVMSRS